MLKNILPIVLLIVCATAGVYAQEVPNAAESENQPKTRLGKTIISVAPIQATNESWIGIGIQAERFIDRDQRFSLCLPVAISFYQDDEYPLNETKKRRFTYLYPGLKMYPKGSQSSVSYFVGPSLAFGFGERYHFVYDEKKTLYNSVTEGNVFVVAAMFNVGLNFQFNPIIAGTEFGIGPRVYGSNDDFEGTANGWLTQLQFKIGYRF